MKPFNIYFAHFFLTLRFQRIFLAILYFIITEMFMGIMNLKGIKNLFPYERIIYDKMPFVNFITLFQSSNTWTMQLIHTKVNIKFLFSEKHVEKNPLSLDIFVTRKYHFKEHQNISLLSIYLVRVPP